MRLVLTQAEWFPQADSGPSLLVTALAEEGKAPTIPAPLIRVPEGTFVDVTIRNTLPSGTKPAEAYGFESYPQQDNKPAPVPAGDSLHRRFSAGAPGTYLYRVATDDTLKKDLHDTPLGAFIVDPAGGSPPDRVLVINGWTQDDDSSHFSVALAFNGRVWPYTEQLTAQVGDTMRWRIVNATDDLHPLHLHGHYFRVISFGKDGRDSLVAPQQQRLDVTQPMQGYDTMMLEWTPETIGNWLFHCHLTFHVDPTYSGLKLPAPPEAHMHQSTDGSHMSGLVMGIHVRPKPGAVEPTRASAQTYRLLIQEGKKRSRSPHARGFVLQRGATPARDSIEIPGTMLVFTRGQPTDVVVVNHLDQPAAVHWHGLELESYSDGAPGWSGVGNRIAPPIAPGDSFVARLTLRRAGTFMYHPHMHDLEQLTSGLYGPLIVLEPGQQFDPAHDHVYVGSWDGREDPPHFLVNGDSLGAPPLNLRVGEKQRFRLIGIGAVSGGRFTLKRDTTTEKWQLVAKDGADVPPSIAQQETVASHHILAGETFDYEWTPRRAGVYTLTAAVEKDAKPWTQRLIVR